MQRPLMSAWCTTTPFAFLFSLTLASAALLEAVSALLAAALLRLSLSLCLLSQSESLLPMVFHSTLIIISYSNIKKI